MQVYVGEFTEKDIASGLDSLEIEKAKIANGLDYINSKIVRKNNKIVGIKIWVCDETDFAVYS